MTLDWLWLALVMLLGAAVGLLLAAVLEGLWARVRRWLGLLVLLPLVEGCGVTLHGPTRCADGLPARLLLDVSCRQGICGATCAPHRWETPCP